MLVAPQDNRLGGAAQLNWSGVWILDSGHNSLRTSSVVPVNIRRIFPILSRQVTLTCWLDWWLLVIYSGS